MDKGPNNSRSWLVQALPLDLHYRRQLTAHPTPQLTVTHVKENTHKKPQRQEQKPELGCREGKDAQISSHFSHPSIYGVIWFQEVLNPFSQDPVGSDAYTG